MPQVRCPACKNVFTASEASRGTRLSCPSCDTPVRIPLRKGTPEAPAAPPAAAREPDPPEEDVLQEVEDDVLEEVVDDKDGVTAAPSPRRRRDEADDDDDEDIPMEVVRKRPRKRRRLVAHDGDMGRVNLGLGFYYASILSLMAGIVAELGAISAGATAGLSLVAGSAEGAISGLGFAVMLGFLAAILINWAAPILGITGSILCLWAPLASESRTLTLVSASLNGSAMAMGLIQAVLAFLPGTELIRLAMLVLAMVMTFVAWCMFMAFLRRLCLFVGEDSLGDEANAVLFRGIGILIATPFLFVGAIFVVILFSRVPVMNLAIAVGICFGFAAWMFMFLRRQLDLIGSIRQVLASRY